MALKSVVKVLQARASSLIDFKRLHSCVFVQTKTTWFNSVLIHCVHTNFGWILSIFLLFGV